MYRGSGVCTWPGFLSPSSLSWRLALPVLDLRVLLRGWRPGGFWPLTGLNPGGLPSRGVLGVVVTPRLPAEKGNCLAHHKPGPGSVLGEGRPRGAALATFSVSEILSRSARGSPEPVGDVGAVCNFLDLCPVFLRTLVLGTGFLDLPCSRKEIHWVLLEAFISELGYSWTR